MGLNKYNNNTHIYKFKVQKKAKKRQNMIKSINIIDEDMPMEKESINVSYKKIENN